MAVPAPHRRPIAAPGSGQGETLGLIAVGTVLMAAGAHLAAAHLAAFVAGSPPLRASLADAAVALVRLFDTLGDPKQAWPPEAAAALPGPVAYWSCVAAVVVGALGLTLLALRLRQRLVRPQQRAGVEPYGGLARPQDLRRLLVRRQVSGRLVLGRINGRLVAAEGDTSLAVVGPSGCGKTAGLAVPAMLEWEGPVICTSVKTDLLEKTLARRRQLGRVWIFDPTDEAGLGCATWSPLGACGTWSGAIRMTAWLAEASAPVRDSVTDGDYWYTQARKGLAPHVHAAAVSGRTMREVVRWIDLGEQDAARQALRDDAGVTGAVEEALRSENLRALRDGIEPRVRAEVVEALRQVLRADPGKGAALAEQRTGAWPVGLQEQLEQRVAEEVDRRLRVELEARLGAEAREGGRLDALISAESLWMKEERLRGSIYATIQNMLLCYADPEVAAATESCEIDMDAWLGGAHTIYVVATPDEQDRLRPVLTVLIQAAIRRAYRTANRTGGRVSHPVLVLLDEAGNIVPLRDLPAYAATARSHGISLVTVWQDLAQVESIYGTRARTVLNNHRAKLFGGGISDEDTLEYLSRLVGDHEQTERTHSTDPGGRRSVSEHTVLRRTLPADAIRRFPANTGLLIYGSELPAHLSLRPWYKDRRLSKLAAGTDQGDGRKAGADQRQLPPWRKLHSLWRRKHGCGRRRLYG